MKSILIGSVGSSKTILEEMLKIDFPIDLVFSLDERFAENVSGYFPLHELAAQNNIPFSKFKKINDPKHLGLIKKLKPDYIFVIGLSQLISKEIIAAAQKGAVGFHPTPLPKFRGRAALVWQLLLGVRHTKCSLFFIDEGIDSGDLLGQEEYIIEDTDYARDVSAKCREAFQKLLQRVLPQMMAGTLQPIKQNEEEATYLLKRTPEDGKIDWNEPVEKIQRLIRAVSKPYPGAFSHYDGKQKVIFWRADYLQNKKYIGLPGQIAQKTKEYMDLVCVDGLLRVYDYESTDGVKMIPGHKFKESKYLFS
jgi:methionyl-tRNA formyltransferase